MKTKFTKGPWKVTPSNKSMTAYIEAENGTIVGQTYRGRAYSATLEKTGEVNFETEVFNAQLIAAAPEMYAALELALEQLEPSPKPKLISLPEYALREIRAALKKARGEI